MNVSIITITCRKDPRLADMAKSILTSLADPGMNGKSLSLEWVIVDEVSRPESEIKGLLALVGNKLRVRRVLPLASNSRDLGLPAHNSSRNAGLQAIDADTDYVFFLNDCSVVSQRWCATAHDAAAQSIGWKFHQMVVGDLKQDKPIVLGVTNDHTIKSVPGTIVNKSLCWGAPRRFFEAIGGFDLAYDGQLLGHDVEAAIRLERVGVKFHTSSRATVVRLSKTAIAAEVSEDRGARLGRDNQVRLNALRRDRERTQPQVAMPVAEAPKKKDKGKGKKEEERAAAPAKPKASKPQEPTKPDHDAPPAPSPTATDSHPQDDDDDDDLSGINVDAAMGAAEDDKE